MIDHECDPLVCALVARARDLHGTQLPNDEDAKRAVPSEGWIHLQDEGLALHDLLAPG
jgi:hypothetical protein